jgi:GTP-binding protein
MTTVAILGRPNVGKSTLFNRLAGRRLALVDDQPGVTRDYRIAPARLGSLEFDVIDTAGLETGTEDTIQIRARKQTEQAVELADVVLFVVDAIAGVTPIDEQFARELRRIEKPLILVANKCEGKSSDSGYAEAYGLGLGEPVAISAEHGGGMADLAEALVPYVAEAPDDAAEESEEEAAKGPIRLAIVGRPNVGKSTLVNSLLGAERVLTGPEPGVTRDAIEIEWEHGGRAVKLVDTAGLRRKARIYEKVEKLATSDTLRALKLAHVAVLVLDGTLGLDKQDLAIAELAETEGRALVVAVNKWDAVENTKEAMARVRDRLEASFAQLKGVPVVTISAERGTGLNKLMDAVLDIHAVWNKRVPTSGLNRWLAEVASSHPPPAASGRANKLRYMTQIKTRPPTFVLWCSRADDLPDTYIRYLVNRMREDLDLPGTPIRLLPRSTKNPYVED